MTATRTLIALLVATTALACRPDIELEVPCAGDGDLSCPSGFQCDGASGRCVAGEAPPRVAFPELQPGAEIKGRIEVAVDLLAVNGIEKVGLAAEGEGSITVGLSPSLTYGDGIQQGTWATPFDTWKLNDGPASIVATVRDSLDQVTTHRLDVLVANGVPAVSIARPQQNALVSNRFEVEASIRSHVPVTSVVARVQGRQYTLTDEVKWATSDRLKGELSRTIGGDLGSGDAVLELVVTDEAGASHPILVDITITSGS